MDSMQASSIVYKVVRALLEEHGNTIAISDETLFKDMGLDSLNVIEAVIKIESEVGKEIKTKDIYEAKTIKDLVTIVENL